MRLRQPKTLALLDKTSISQKLKTEGSSIERLLPAIARLLPAHLEESPATCLRRDQVLERPTGLLQSMSKLSTPRSSRMLSRRSCSRRRGPGKLATGARQVRSIDKPPRGCTRADLSPACRYARSDAMGFLEAVRLVCRTIQNVVRPTESPGAQPQEAMSRDWNNKTATCNIESANWSSD